MSPLPPAEHAMDRHPRKSSRSRSPGRVKTGAQFALFFGCIFLLILGLGIQWFFHVQRQRTLLADQRTLDRTAELVSTLARNSTHLTSLAREAVATGELDPVVEFRETARSSAPQGPQVVPGEDTADAGFIDEIRQSLERLRDMDSTLKRTDYETLAEGLDDAAWLLQRDEEALAFLVPDGQGGTPSTAAASEILYSGDYTARRRAADEHFNSFLASLDIRLYAIKERLGRDLGISSFLGGAIILSLLVLAPLAAFTLHRQVSESLAFLRLQVRKINDELARTLSQLNSVLGELDKLRKRNGDTPAEGNTPPAQRKEDQDDLITRLP